MKIFNMRSKGIIKGLVLLTSVSMATTACLKDDSAEKQAAHDQAFAAMLDEYDMSADDSIADGVYMHVTEIMYEDTLMATPGDYIIINLAGYNSDGNLIDVTDSASAAAEDLYRSDLVYGPVRININNTFLGFYTAIQQLPQGSCANMVFSADQAFGGYEPIAYKVQLYRVIDNYTEYIDTCYANYRDSLELSDLDLYTGTGYDNVYYRIDTAGTTLEEIEIGDMVTIELNAYYAETDPVYETEVPGREFFPFTENADTVEFSMGTLYFPITDIVSEMVSDSMRINEVRTILTPAEYAYGSSGFVHPYTGTYLVPPGMPLHYYIKLIDVADPQFK